MFLHFSCPRISFEIPWHQRQWNPFVFGWHWLLSSLRTWTMARRFSLTNIPKGLDYEKTRLLPSSVLSISMIGHRKDPRVSFVPKTMFWSRSRWPPSAIFRKPSREFSWNINPMSTAGREQWDPKSMTSAEIFYTDFPKRLTKSFEHRGNTYILFMYSF